MDISTNSVRVDAFKNQLFDLLAGLRDPELDFIGIYDLGILRDVQVEQVHSSIEIKVTITPSFSGCPAMLVITEMIKTHLKEFINKLYQDKKNNFSKINFKIIKQLSPPWGSGFVTSKGREILRSNGIAFEESSVICPRCNSIDTKIISWFGSTACKSLARCLSCKEPFEVFKKI